MTEEGWELGQSSPKNNPPPPKGIIFENIILFSQDLPVQFRIICYLSYKSGQFEYIFNPILEDLGIILILFCSGKIDTLV